MVWLFIHIDSVENEEMRKSFGNFFFIQQNQKIIDKTFYYPVEVLRSFCCTSNYFLLGLSE